MWLTAETDEDGIVKHDAVSGDLSSSDDSSDSELEDDIPPSSDEEYSDEVRPLLTTVCFDICLIALIALCQCTQQASKLLHKLMHRTAQYVESKNHAVF